MKKISYIIFAVSAVLLLSCTRENELQENGAAGLQTQELTISAGIATKTLLHEGKVKWENGDQIAVVFTHPTAGAHVNREFSAVLDGEMAATADFQGHFSQGVNSANGYQENAFAVYPRTAVKDDGTISFELPAQQTAVAGGSFPSKLNLSSSAISLSDVEDDYHAHAFFRNALSYFRFNLDDNVKSVTFTGTSPMAGTAPLEVYYDVDPENADHGRLKVTDGSWNTPSNSITLLPEGGKEFFTEGTNYNLLVWPGSHSTLTITLDFGTELGTYDIVKTFADDYTFAPGKYYNVNFSSDPEQILNGAAGELTVVEAEINDIDGSLDDLEGKVEALSSQIQSISVLSDYTDNAVFARYSTFSDIQKADFEVNYVIRPASAAAAVLDRYQSSDDILTGQVYYKTPSGIEVGTPLSVRNASLSGDVLTVTMNPANLRNDFYSGDNLEAEVALQVYDEVTKTSILSDNVKVLPYEGSGLKFTSPESMKVIKESTVSIPFSYSLCDPMPAGKNIADYIQFNTAGGATAKVVAPYVTSDRKGGGHVQIDIANAAVAGQTVDVVLDYGEDVFIKSLTFSDGGTFEVTTLSGSNNIDHIGGEITLVVNTTFNTYTGPTQQSGGEWLTHMTSGMGTHTYAASENTTAGNRGASFTFSIPTDTGVTCSKSISITQGKSGDPLTGSYYSDGQTKVLKESDWDSKPLNLVILGDGYQQKDLAKGGKFERSAVNAMNAFFSIEPFKSFEDRFHVYMATYQSNAEGTDNKATSTYVDTYFNIEWTGSSTLIWFADGSDGMSKVQNAVQNVLNLDKYRTVAIVLVNTDATAGSASYIDHTAGSYSNDYGEDYRHFGVAVLAANNFGFSGLVRHEAGGHAFGRLADEYTNEGKGAVYSGNLSTAHAKGQYRNVCTDGAYWNDLIDAGYSAYVGYVEGGMSCDSGIYRPTAGGIMYNNQGEFNAVCRRVIYERIIRQTEGASAYSLQKFVDYDKINLSK